MASLNENPMVALLEIRARRHPHKLDMRLVLALLVVAPLMLGTIAAATIEYCSFYHGLLQAAKVFGGSTLVSLGLLVSILSLHQFIALPFILLSTNTSALTGLRRGGGLEELLNSGYSSAQVLDGLAAYNALAFPRSLNSFQAILAILGSAFLLVGGGVAPAHLLGGALLWAAIMPILSYATTYPVALNIIWDEELGRGTLYQLVRLGVVGLTLMMSAFMLVAILVLSIYSVGSGDLVYETGLAVAWIVGYLIQTRMARGLALVGMEKLPRFLAKANSLQARFLRRRRNPFVHSITNNPIEFRESLREAVATPFGLLGLLALRLPLLCLAILLVFPEPQAWGGVVITLSVVSFVMATHKTLNVFLGDCERKTWEPLCQSGLTARELIDGMLWVGFRWRLVEAIGILVLGVLTHQQWNNWYLVLLGLPMLGCALGLSGALAGSRMQAHQSCSNTTLLLLLLWSLLTATVPLPAFMTAAYLVGSAFLLRYRVLRKVGG